MASVSLGGVAAAAAAHCVLPHHYRNPRRSRLAAVHVMTGKRLCWSAGWASSTAAAAPLTLRCSSFGAGDLGHPERARPAATSASQHATSAPGQAAEEGVAAVTERVTFNDGSETRFAPLLNGCWSLAGGHGAVDRTRAIDTMAAHARRGLTTFDTADIYGPSESILGDFRHEFEGPASASSSGSGPGSGSGVQIFTKFVPNIFQGRHVTTPAYVEAAVRKSMRALQVARLDLVQLHWWDYAIPGLADVAKTLTELRERGLIASIGVTNMNTDALAGLVDAGVPVVCNQVQLSLLDQRALRGPMMRYCRDHDIKLFSYGTLAGGLLSDRYVVKGREGGGSDGGAAAAQEKEKKSWGLFGMGGGGSKQASEKPELTTSSLKMFWRTVEEAGGGAYWQQLLLALRGIADKHDVSAADVALRWAMDQGPVHPIIGMRNATHIDDNLRVFAFSLDAEDRAALDAVTSAAQGPRGDCFDMERGA